MMAANRKHRKLRWGRVLLLVVFLVLCMSLAVSAFGNDDTAPRPVVEVVVAAGDSIWQLVKEHNPDYDGDMRKAVYEVRQLNQLDSACLEIGQSLTIPTDF